MAETEHNLDWSEIVYRGVETQELDYKAALNWNALSRAGKAKFARHAMAMANSRGGYIVVGVGEDEHGNPTDYTGLTETQLRSFDPSTVGQTVNRYADPSVDFDIVRPEVDSRRYAIFVIHRFSTLPHVCSDSCGGELQQGAFYIRTPDARSQAAYRASEIHALVQRALRNQRQALGRMLRGVLYEGGQQAEPDTEREFGKLLAQVRVESRKTFGPKHFRLLNALEVNAYPSEALKDPLPLSEVRKAAESVLLPPLADFPLLQSRDAQAYFTNRSLLCRRAESNAMCERFYCEIFQNGMFHHVSCLEPEAEQKAIRYPVLIRRIGAAVAALGQLYSALDLEETLLVVTFRLTNVEGARLVSSETGDPDELRCYVPEISVRRERTAADLVSDPVEHAVTVTREVCERFNLSADEHVGLRRALTEFLHGGPP